MDFWTILLIILVIAVAVMAVLYFMGRKMEKRQAEQQEAIEAAKQTVSILTIDKKRLKIKESGLPKMVIDQTPGTCAGRGSASSRPRSDRRS